MKAASSTIGSPWLTATEAAAYARRGRRQILHAVRNGKLRAARIGGRREILTRTEWIDEWIASEVAVVPISGRLMNRR